MKAGDRGQAEGCIPGAMKPLTRYQWFAGTILAVGLVATCTQGGATLVTLASFNGTNGANPEAELLQGADGTFYGTTAFGGAYGYGTVFQMAPSGGLTTLVWFNGTNGANPRAGLVLGTDGNLYGTTYAGGVGGDGLVFGVTTNGGLATLAQFTGTNGIYPKSGLLRANDGSLYGTTVVGGTNGHGTIYQITTNGALVTLVSFDSSGYSPYAGLVQGTGGDFYGTTFQGGTNGHGTVFKATTNGELAYLHSFSGSGDGGNPYGGLVQGTDGVLYGSTFFGGTNNCGTIFKLTTNGALTTLAAFNGTNGAYPQAALLLAADGNLYGTTTAGGAYTNQSGSGYGTLFMLKLGGTLTTLVSFNGTNGASPQAGLVQGTDGSFYGTTAYGGANGSGSLFRLTLAPPAPPVLQATQTGGALALSWSAAAGEQYQVQYKTDLNASGWSNLRSAVTATNVAMTVLDTIGPDLLRFYRVLLLP